MDGSGPLAVLCALPWLLWLAGVDARGALHAVALLFLGLSVIVAASAARRRGEPRLAWRGYALAAGLTGLGIAAGVGGLGAPVMIVALAVHLAPRLRWVRAERVLGALQLALPVVAAAVYFVIARGGDLLPAAAVAADLVALVLAGLLTTAWRRTQDRAVARRLWAVTAAALLADALAAGSVGGASAAYLAATVHAVQGWLLAGAALSERPAPRPADQAVAGVRAPNVLAPAALLAAFPLLAGWAIALDGPGAWPHRWFAATGAVALLVTCARFAVESGELRRTLADERLRRVRAERRSEELEAVAADDRERLDEALRDPLTGAYNRRFFDEALAKEIQRARRYDTSASLVLLDVAGAGDAGLCAVARVADGLLRPADSVARLGDGDFALLLPETTQAQAVLVVERLRAAIAREGGLDVAVTAGVAACPEDAEAREELLQSAQAALAWATSEGAAIAGARGESRM